MLKVGDKVKILPTILSEYPAGGVLGGIWNLYLFKTVHEMMIICRIFWSISNI